MQTFLAYDLFHFIKQQAPDALTNPEVGKKYVAAIFFELRANALNYLN